MDDATSVLWVAAVYVVLQLAGCATAGPVPAVCSAQPAALSSESHATRTAREQVERGLLPLVALSGTADTAFTLADRMEFYRVPGVSIAVIDNGRIAWSRTYGVRDTGHPEPVTRETLFQAGSISKTVAAVTALRKVVEGHLTLDEDVNRTLRTWRIPDDTMTRGRPVTLRRLLSHSAGFNVPSFRGYDQGAALPSLVEILSGTGPANTAGGRVEIPPGSEWRYSGIGTEVVRLLIEDATGREYSAVAEEEVLAAAGMCLTTFSQRPDTLGRVLASGHSGGSPIQGRWRLHPELAAAGMWSTAEDLARLAVSLGAPLRGEPNGVLPESILREAMRRQIGNWGLGFALGPAGGDSATFGHDGSTAGFAARLLMFPDGRRGLVVMTNGESEALINEIQRSVAATYGWPVRPRTVRAIVAVQLEHLAGLTGRYRITLDDRTIDIAFTTIADRLAFVGSSGRPALLFAESPVRYFSRESGTTFSFEPAHGPARRVTIDQSGQHFVAERLP